MTTEEIEFTWTDFPEGVHIARTAGAPAARLVETTEWWETVPRFSLHIIERVSSGAARRIEAASVDEAKRIAERMLREFAASRLEGISTRRLTDVGPTR